MNASFANGSELVRPGRRLWRVIGAALLACAFALSGAAVAQHSGGGHSGGGAHFSGGHGAVGHGYRGGYYGGRGWYGHGWYGGWGGWGWGWYGPWAYGAFLATLPWYYETYWWNGVPYYYADDTYYQWNDAARGYVVVPPPGGGPNPAAGGAAAPASTDLFAYPTNGQTAEQQSKDRYECHRWAADQTGFDPTQAGGVQANEAAAKREGYVRAEAACLSGRGYSVR
jgi:hypothetical protein